MAFKLRKVKDAKETFGAVAAEIDPYENWEKATVPAHERAPDKRRWQPVYLQLEGDPRISARKLREAARKREQIFRIGLFEDSILFRVEKLKHGDPVPEEYLRLFAFRPETDAYVPLCEGSTRLYSVLHVGPAIPMAFVENLIDWPRRYPARGNRRGDGVVTAVIDDFIGFANTSFRSGESESRFHWFWAQGQPVVDKSSSPVEIGTIWGKGDMDRMLSPGLTEPEIYAKYYPDGIRSIGRTLEPMGANDIRDPALARPFDFLASHGTHVADIAAGYPMEDERRDQPIIGVQLPRLATQETWGARLDVFILMAVQRILDWADRWSELGQTVRAPVVINISYGILAGPKDGTGFLEAEIARLVRLRNAGGKGIPTAVVFPAGNGYRADCHAEKWLPPGKTARVSLRVQPEDLSVTFVEIWIEQQEPACFTLTLPNGEVLAADLTGAAIWDVTEDGPPLRIVGRVYDTDLPNGRRRVVLALGPTLDHETPDIVAPAGEYGLMITNTSKRRQFVTIGVQRDDTPSAFPAYGRQAYLDHEGVGAYDPATADWTLPGAGPVTRQRTISAYSTSGEQNFIVVGAAIGAGAPPWAALYAGAGVADTLPSRPRQTPDIGAISEEGWAHPGVLATGTYSGSSALFQGSSAAAPQVTRAIVRQFGQMKSGTDVDVRALLRGGSHHAKPDLQLGRGTLAFDWPGQKIARRRTC